MESKYSPKNIEKKWQKAWEREGIYKVHDFSSKKKFYCLVEFPYPSGAGLHVGHVRAWSAMDAYARKKRMEGYQVLYPMGWDAFGLPAENYAIRMGVHPSITTTQNIANFKEQIKSLGLSFDWSREINTTDPKYYRWTQWIFLKLLEKGLAYRSAVAVNWCPFCKTNLADEEVLPDGTHERCGTLVKKRQQDQWLLRITRYADRLIDDLNLVDFPDKVANQQINWIGHKEGTLIKFQIPNSKYQIGEILSIEVFTTRPETIFGATFLVLAPEHPVVAALLNSKSQIPLVNPSGYKDLNNYVEAAKKKSEKDRIAKGRKKTGVFSGLFAVNPLNGAPMPVWVADYVLASYGTGAIMAVPAHDRRDFEFAKEHGLPIKQVVLSNLSDLSNLGSLSDISEPYEGEGKMINSGFLDGLDTKTAVARMTDYLEEKALGKRQVTYHLHDWIFSRQHYWGEPIPVIYCSKCLENSKLKIQNSKFMTTVENGTEYAIVPVPEDQLPVELPYVERYQPSGTGESPLAVMTDWVNTTCPKCGGSAKRETDTMPNWAGSNWYYLAYLLADKLGNSKYQIPNSKQIQNSNFVDIFTANKNLIDYWMPVNVYEGGFEHTTLHLLYSRFIYKFLYDIGAVAQPEPYTKRRSHGIVLGPDGRKMSKSFGNVVSPSEIVEKVGADALRLYEMFMGPFEQTVAWSDESLQGGYRFLGKVSHLFETAVGAEKTESDLRRRLLRTVKKVGEDLDALKFNTAVAALMGFVNDWARSSLSYEDAGVFVRILAPFAPHLAEELWQKILNRPQIPNSKYQIPNTKFQIPNSPPAPKLQRAGKSHLEFGASDFDSVHLSPWPSFEESEIAQERVVVVVEVNGKVRGRLDLDAKQGSDQQLVEEKARQIAPVAARLAKGIKNVVFMPGKLINFVV